MKKQINLNVISNQIYNKYKELNIDNKEYLLETFNNIVKNNNIDEYSIIKLLNCLFALSKEKNIDLNKYFPCFVEI